MGGYELRSLARLQTNIVVFDVHVTGHGAYPDFLLKGDVLDFGVCAMGYAYMRHISILNSGNVMLQWTIPTMAKCFKASSKRGTLLPREHVSVEILFSPDAVGLFPGDFIVESRGRYRMVTMSGVGGRLKIELCNTHKVIRDYVPQSADRYVSVLAHARQSLLHISAGAVPCGVPITRVFRVVNAGDVNVYISPSVRDSTPRPLMHSTRFQRSSGARFIGTAGDMWVAITPPYFCISPSNTQDVAITLYAQMPVSINVGFRICKVHDSTQRASLIDNTTSERGRTLDSNDWEVLLTGYSEMLCVSYLAVSLLNCDRKFLNFAPAVPPVCDSAQAYINRPLFARTFCNTGDGEMPTQVVIREAVASIISSLEQNAQNGDPSENRLLQTYCVGTCRHAGRPVSRLLVEGMVAVKMQSDIWDVINYGPSVSNVCCRPALCMAEPSSKLLSIPEGCLRRPGAF